MRELIKTFLKELDSGKITTGSDSATTSENLDISSEQVKELCSLIHQLNLIAFENESKELRHFKRKLFTDQSEGDLLASLVLYSYCAGRRAGTTTFANTLYKSLLEALDD